MAYKTSWLQRLIDGAWQKTFAFAHAKTVYTDYANKKTLADKLSEIDTEIGNKANKTEIPTELPANGGNSATVNGHTVKSDVPENAVFTDTVYDDTNVKEEIDKINSNLTSEISRAKETEETLKSRIDTITSLPEGSTTGDAELQDIRVKADGTTATSAGNAVREQFSELKGDLDDISYFSQNVHDSSTDVDGFLNSGTLSSTIGFRTTDYIDAKVGNTFYFYNNDNPIQCRFIEEYYVGNDGQNYFLSGYGAQNVYSYRIQSQQCEYIRVSFELSDSSMVMVSTKQLDAYYPYGRIINNDKIIGLAEKQRQKIIINHTEDIHDYYNKMLQAFEQGDCDVYISKGDYIYTNAFMIEIRSQDKYSRGVPIGNGCRYYFENGAKIIAKYTGEHESVYNIRGLFSPLDSTNQAGSYELYGANIEAENTVYAIHDECASGVSPYKHVYKDCILSYKVDSLGESLGKCIGGGSGQYGTINIENCSFNTVNPNTASCPDVSYHGSKDNTKNNLDIFINNCYFSHHFEGHDGSGEGTMNLYFSSNSVDSLNILTESTDHWNVKQWSNELRTS